MVLRFIKKATSKKRLMDELLYEIALQELESGTYRYGIWSEALAKSSGNESLARSLYIRYRVRSLRDESTQREVIEKSNKEPDLLEEELHFKSNEAAFEYACRFGKSNIEKGHPLPALVVRKPNNQNKATIQVASMNGGFFTEQHLLEDQHNDITEGSLVLWRPIACGDRESHKEELWAGSIDAELYPSYHIKEGWKIRAHY